MVTPSNSVSRLTAFLIPKQSQLSSKTFRS
jgi:hypothetical protein